MANSINIVHEMVNKVGWDVEDIDVKRVVDLAEKAGDLMSKGLVKEAGVAFDELGDMFNKKLKEMGRESIDFTDLIKMPDAGTLEKMTSGFATAIAKNISNGIEAGLKDAGGHTKKFMKDATTLRDTYEKRLRNDTWKRTGKHVKHGFVSKAKQAFEYEPADTALGIGKNLGHIKSEYNKAKNADVWEDQYVALLKYIKAYEKLEKVSKNPETLEKWSEIDKGISIQTLKDARPEIEHTLQNIFNVAYNKALTGLTDTGEIDVDVKLTPIKMIDVYDVVGKKGKIEVEVVPVVKRARSNVSANMLRGVHKPEDGEGRRHSRDALGASYWASPDSAEFIARAYGEESLDGGDTVKAYAKPLNPLKVSAEVRDENNHPVYLNFDQIDQITLLKYLFPGVEKFKTLGSPDGRDRNQKFYNEMARQFGFDLFEIDEVNEGKGRETNVDEINSLQSYLTELKHIEQQEKNNGKLTENEINRKRELIALIKELNLELTNAEAKTRYSTNDFGKNANLTADILAAERALSTRDKKYMSQNVNEKMPLQPRIIEYVGRVPDYLDVEKFTPDMERVIISREKGTAERSYADKITELEQKLAEATDIANTGNYRDKKLVSRNDDVRLMISQLPAVIEQIKQMRDNALRNFDLEIEKYGGYIEEEVQRGLPKVIEENEYGELIGKVTEGTLKERLEEIKELSVSASKTNNKEKRNKLEHQIDQIEQIILDSISDDLKDDAIDILSDIKTGDKSITDATQFFKPYLTYDMDELSVVGKVNDVIDSNNESSINSKTEASSLNKSEAIETLDEVEDGIERATAKMRTYDEEIRRAHEHFIKLAKDGASIYEESYDPFDDPLANRDFFKDFGDQDGHIDQDELFSTLSQKYGQVEYMNEDREHVRLKQSEEMVEQIEKAYKRLGEIDNPYEINDEETLNRLYQERLDIIDRIGAANLKNYNKFKFEEIENVNDYYRDFIDQMKSQSDTNESVDATDNTEIEKLRAENAELEEYIQRQADQHADDLYSYREEWAEANARANEAEDLNKKIYDDLLRLNTTDIDTFYDHIRQDAMAAKPAVEAVGDAQERLNAINYSDHQISDEIKQEAVSYEELRQKVEAYYKIRQSIMSLMDQNQPWQHLMPDLNAAKKDIASYLPDTGDKTTVTSKWISNYLNETMDDEETVLSKVAKTLGVEIPQAAQVAKTAVEAVNDEITKIKSQSDIESKIEQMSSVDSIPYEQLEQEAVNVSKKLGAMYDDGIRDTEEYVALQYKLLNIFDELERAHGGVNGSGALNTYQLMEWISDAIGRKTGHNPMRSSSFEAINADDGTSVVSRMGAQMYELHSPEEMAEKLSSKQHKVFDEIINDASVAQRTVDALNDSIEETKNAAQGTGTGDSDASSAELENNNEELERLRKELAETDAENNAKLQAAAEKEARLQEELANTRQQLTDEKEEISAYDRALSELTDEVHEKNRIIYDLQEQLENASNNISENAGSGDAIDTTGEQQQIDNIKKSVAGVTTAVKEKTQEFLNEQAAVKKAAQSEVHALDEVEKKVTAIRVALSNVNTLLNNVKKGNDIGAGLSNITVNVHHTTDEKEDKTIAINNESLKQTLGEVVYNVKTVNASAQDSNDETGSSASNGVKTPEQNKQDEIVTLLTRIKVHTHNTVRQIRDNVVPKMEVKEDAGASPEIKGILEQIQINTANKPESTNADGVKLATEGTLEAIKKAVNSIKGKVGNKNTNKNESSDNRFAAKNNGKLSQSDVNNIIKDYEKLGKLRARFEHDGDIEAKAQLQVLAEEVAYKRESLELTSDEIIELRKKSDVAYEAEKKLLAAAKQQEQIEEARKSAADKAAKAEKELAKTEKKAMADEKRLAKRQAMTGKSGSAIGRAENIWLNAEGLDQSKLPEDFKKQVAEYYDAIDTLRVKQNEVASAKTAAEIDKLSDGLIQQTNHVNKLTKALGPLVAQYERLSGENTEVIDGTQLAPNASLREYEQGLKDAVMAATNGKAQIKGFNNETKVLTYTVSNAAHEVTEYTAEVRELDKQYTTTAGKTKRLETFFEATKRKMKELTSYFSGMAVFNRISTELRRGIQYVREIDLALTELKKVTDETEETYDKFLETAAKTADKVGSTIQKVVSSTADWARLGSILAKTNIRPII